MLHPGADLQIQVRRQGTLRKGKYGGIPGPGRQQVIRAFPQGGEIAVLELQSQCCAGKRPQGAQKTFYTGIPARIIEGGRGAAARQSFTMGIIGIAGIDVHRLQRPSVDGKRGTEQPLGLFHVDVGGIRRDAVAGIVMDHGGAGAALVVSTEKIRAAEGIAVPAEKRPPGIA